MSRSRQVHTNFSGGVISKDAEARLDSPEYNSGLSEGKNIIIKTTGAMSRRPGTLFVNNYGSLEYMRMFPFIFNSNQKYIIILYLDEPDPIGAPGVYDGLVDIYRDGVLVLPGLVTPYNTEKKIREIDVAQSADTMVFAQGDHEPQLLRRLGADDSWEFIDAPLINTPCEGMACEDDGEPGTYVPPTCTDGSTPWCGTGKCTDDSDPTCATAFTLVTLMQWTDTNGWPQHVTFHQGRLWFAGSNTYPQSVWSSKSQDFFNFDVGIGDPADSIQETLDTDFINPITSIYSGGRLMLFTSGAEFYNPAHVLTPTSSAWLRQTTYGSSARVNPQSVDGTVLFLDNTERIFRQFTYNDTINGYDAPSISSESEDLIKAPIAMGAMRGGVQEASNFVYVVNGDGTMAVLNLSKAYKVNAWVTWETQGFYQDVMDLDRELYILVKRYVDVAGVLELQWMLELVNQASLTDSGSINESLTETTITAVGKNDDNFFGVYQEPNSDRGKVVIVMGGAVVYKADWLKYDPLSDVINTEDVRYGAGNVFNVDEDVRELYFDPEVGYRWYMHVVSSLQLENRAHNYIDGLTHLIDQDVVAVLDGNAFMDEMVVPGDTQDTVENTYPDGVDWLYDTALGTETFIQSDKVDGAVVKWRAWYEGIFYDNLIDTQWGLLISGDAGVTGSEYLQLGVEEESTLWDNPIVFSSDDTVTAGVDFPALADFDICLVGGGGGGAQRYTSSGRAGGGHASALVQSSLNVPYAESVLVSIGAGGTASASSPGGSGGSSSFGSYATAPGGAGGSTTENSFDGNNELVVSPCGGDFYNGTQYYADEGLYIIGGGQASAFGHGGDSSSSVSELPTNGGIGAGGGADAWCCGDPGFDNPGEGGPGIIKIYPVNSDTTSTYRTRKMVLATTTVTDGVVMFPDDPYRVGEAGLFFDVKATSLPINVSAGGGSLVNEPKRLVAITAKMVDTQGLTINGISIPERQFGEEVFDRAMPRITGATKIRLLGYNRDTRVYISQDTPMPMTLASLDIEVNY
ncbi:MAG: hypothetical protein DRG30_01140 [Epsilonproteobacteria bacterium]|nr:MAG: hypothetical protein DRG30_01140 [Campylobacterota bacterium]